MTPSDLIAFEREVADRYERGEIRGPVHLSGGNEDQLIDIFREMKREDWVFSTWRSHYHALLHGVPPEKVMAQILAGRSMNLNFPEYRFFTSAIVGGILPIAVGVAYSGRKVWCFIGDMTARGGAFQEASEYAYGNDLPISFIIEDNDLSTNAPTNLAWGYKRGDRTHSDIYHYSRIFPHVGTGTFVRF